MPRTLNVVCASATVSDSGLDAASAASSAVMVVPTFAPSVTGYALRRLITPAPATHHIVAFAGVEVIAPGAANHPVIADAAVKELDFNAPYCVDADHIGLKNVDLFIDSSDFFTLDVADFTGEPADRGGDGLRFHDNRAAGHEGGAVHGDAAVSREGEPERGEVPR